MSSTLSTGYGAGLDHFGHADYVRHREQGVSDQEIKQFLDANPNVLREGNVPGGGGLYDEIVSGTVDATKAQFQNRPASQVGGGSQAPAPQPVAPDWESGSNPYKTLLDEYKRNFQALEDKYNVALADSGDWRQQAQDWEAKFGQASTDADIAKSEAEGYREEAVRSQLEGLRSGGTVAGDQGRPGGIGLASGATAYSAPQGKDGVINIQRNVDASDSVLNRKGPIVEMFQRARARARARQGRPGGQQLANQVARTVAGYYGGRFA